MQQSRQWKPWSIILMLVACSLLGCADVAYLPSRALGVDCRPEKLQNGQCVATR